MASILGKMEERAASKDEENVFRIMIPILKMFVAKEVYIFLYLKKGTNLFRQ